MLIPDRITARLSRTSSISLIGAPIFAIGLIFLLAIATSHAQQDASTSGPQAQYTAEGTERCVHCHSGERITDMASTVHGDLDNPHTPYSKQGCESCHGPGSLHVSRARGGRGFPLLIGFRKEEPIGAQTEACITCHGKQDERQEGMEWYGSMHATDEITCVSCHELHIDGNPLKDQKHQLGVCAECHEEQITDHRRFENVGIVFDNLSCYECHDVHQLIGEH